MGQQQLRIAHEMSQDAQTTGCVHCGAAIEPEGFEQDVDPTCEGCSSLLFLIGSETI